MANQNSAVAPTLVVHFSLGIPGCTNPNACNFNPEATIDDGSCILPRLTCNDCLPPQEDDITLYKHGTTVGVAWDAIPEADSYIFHYKATGDAEFRTYDTSIPFVILFGLNDCTTYEFVISTTCDNGNQSEKSEPVSYTTTACRKAGENITISNEQLVAIYPNPATNYLSIELVGGDEVDLINIYDATGKLVVDQNKINYDGFVYKTNVKHLSQGIYFVKIIKDDYAITKKFLVGKG